MTQTVRAAGFLLAATLQAAPLAAQDTAILMGTVSYRERVALSPTAVVEVRIEDVTQPAANAPVVARVRIERPGQVPVRFNLEYDPQQLNPRGRYAARATITDGGVVVFASTDTALVLTQGHGERVDLNLTRVGTARPQVPADQTLRAPALPPPPFPNLPATFTGTVPCTDCEGIRYHLNLFPDDSFTARMTYVGKAGGPVDDFGSWALSSDRRMLVLKGRDEAVQVFAVPAPGQLRRVDADGRLMKGRGANELRRTTPFRSVEVRGLMRGGYSYTADAAWFVECSTGQRWPVAKEAASRDLENAYLKVRPAPAASVLFEVEGVVRTQPALVVGRVVRALPKETCAPRFASAPLTDTHWRLTHLGDRSQPAVTDPRLEPSLTFDADSSSYSGSSGCTRLVGAYTAMNAAMSFKAGGTMKACKDEGRTEAELLAALKATRRYRITGRVLELFDEKGTRVARFEARVPAGISLKEARLE